MSGCLTGEHLLWEVREWKERCRWELSKWALKDEIPEVGKDVQAGARAQARAQRPGLRREHLGRKEGSLTRGGKSLPGNSERETGEPRQATRGDRGSGIRLASRARCSGRPRSTEGHEERAIQGGRFGSGAWSELEAEGNGEGNFTRWICVRETQEQTTLQFFRIYS